MADLFAHPLRGRSFLALLLVIVALAFAGRAAYVVAVTRHQPNPSLISSSPGATRSFDELYYQEGARRLVDGDGFKNPLFGPRDDEAAYHPPMAIVMLAPAAWLAEDSVVAMRLTMALAGSVVVALAGLIGREVAGDRAGLLAAGLAAVYPNLWMNDGILMVETLATLGTAAAVWFAYRLVRRPAVANAVGVGVSITVAALSRAELLMLVPLFGLAGVVVRSDVAVRRRLVLGGVVVLAALATLAPWIGYNLARFEKPVLISYGDGDTLIGANCDRAYFGSLVGFHDGTCGLTSVEAEPSVAAAEKRSRAIRYAGDHLGRLPIVMAARVGRAWGVFGTFQTIDLLRAEGRPKWASLLGWAMLLPLVGLAVGGAVALRRRGTVVVPLLVPIVAVTVAAALAYGSPRFRAPAEASIVVLAAVAVDALIRRRHLPVTAPAGSTSC